MKRKLFTFFRSFFEAMLRLRTKKDKADAYDILCNYALNGAEPDLTKVSPQIATAFEFARPVLDTAAKRSAKLQARLAEKTVQAAQNGLFTE